IFLDIFGSYGLSSVGCCRVCSLPRDSGDILLGADHDSPRPSHADPHCTTALCNPDHRGEGKVELAGVCGFCLLLCRRFFHWFWHIWCLIEGLKRKYLNIVDEGGSKAHVTFTSVTIGQALPPFPTRICQLHTQMATMRCAFNFIRQ